MGTAPVKATVEGGLIRPGDLLVTASLPGDVMRCDHLRRCEGALIGKALEPLEEGRGIIVDRRAYMILALLRGLDDEEDMKQFKQI